MERACANCDYCYYIEEKVFTQPGGRENRRVPAQFMCRRYPQYAERQVAPYYWCGEFKEKK